MLAAAMPGKLGRTWPYLISLVGIYLAVKAGQEHPINPLTIGAIMPMVLAGPASLGDRWLRRIEAAGRALTKDPDENGQEA